MIIFSAFLISLFIAYLLTPYIRKFGIRSNILAYPNKRSIHESPIPTIGGMSFFISSLFSFLLFENIFSQKAFLLGSIVIFIVGLIDDSTDLRPTIKLFGQILGVGIFFLFYFLEAPPLKFRLQDLPTYLFLYFFIIGIINAINLIDGLDGLAAGVFIISSLEFLYLLHAIKDLTLIIVSLLGGVIGFLFFNFYPAYIFMGDTGSNFLGFSLGIFSFFTVIYYGFFPGIIYIFLILSLPFLDTSFAIIRRIIKRQPIFKADKFHIHHLLLKIGISHPRAVVIMWAFSASSFLPLMFIKKINTPYFQIFIASLYYVFLIWSIIYINKKSKLGGGESV